VDNVVFLQHVFSVMAAYCDLRGVCTVHCVRVQDVLSVMAAYCEL